MKSYATDWDDIYGTAQGSETKVKGIRSADRVKSKNKPRRAQSEKPGPQSSRRKSQLMQFSGNFFEVELKIRLNVSLRGLSGALV